MNELLETIRIAAAEGATADQRAAGAVACKTIQTALEAAAGKPMAPPGVPAPSPLAGIDAGQALDLVIARLRAALPTETAERKNEPVRFAFVQPRRK
jgi:hypothetical protein